MVYREQGKRWNLPDVVSFGNLDLVQSNYFYSVKGYREPKAGEYYLSGAIIQAYKTNRDLNTKYLVVEPTHKATKKWSKS